MRYFQKQPAVLGILNFSIIAKYVHLFGFEILTFGNICVQRRRFEVSLIVTWDGSKGLINARPGRTIGAMDTMERRAFLSEANDSDKLGVSVYQKNK